MITLIIDTSTERSLIAFAQEKKVLFAQNLPFGLRSSHYMLREIERGFKELSISSSNLGAICVTIGPGSFTGVRVGVAFAKGMAYARSLPLIGISSLKGFVSQKQGRFASIIDARIGGAYVLLQERMGDEIISIGEVQLVSRENLEDCVAGCVCCVGPDFRKLSLLNGEEVYPDPSQLARLALTTPAIHDPSELKITYLRETVKL